MPITQLPIHGYRREKSMSIYASEMSREQSKKCKYCSNSACRFGEIICTNTKSPKFNEEALSEDDSCEEFEMSNY